MQFTPDVPAWQSLSVCRLAQAPGRDGTSRGGYAPVAWSSIMMLPREDCSKGCPALLIRLRMGAKRRHAGLPAGGPMFPVIAQAHPNNFLSSE